MARAQRESVDNLSTEAKWPKRLAAYAPYLTNKHDPERARHVLKDVYVYAEELPHHTLFLPASIVGGYKADAAAWFQAYITAAAALDGFERAVALQQAATLRGVSFERYNSRSGCGFAHAVYVTPDVIESWNVSHDCSTEVVLYAPCAAPLDEIRSWWRAGYSEPFGTDGRSQHGSRLLRNSHALSSRKPTFPTVHGAAYPEYRTPAQVFPLSTGLPSLDEVGVAGLGVIARTQQRDADAEVLVRFLRNAVAFYPTYLHMERDMPGAFEFFMGSTAVIPSNLMESLADRSAFPNAPLAHNAGARVRAWFQSMWRNNFAAVANAALLANGGRSMTRAAPPTPSRMASLASVSAPGVYTHAPGFSPDDNPMVQVLGAAYSVWTADVYDLETF